MFLAARRWDFSYDQLDAAIVGRVGWLRRVPVVDLGFGVLLTIIGVGGFVLSGNPVPLVFPAGYWAWVVFVWVTRTSAALAAPNEAERRDED